ncbi:MAG: heme-binding protein [Rhodospirillales bacterium]|nr:heme-binding protein [Rhodospirillales bacterium]
MLDIKTLSLEDAQTVVDAVIAHAKKINHKGIAVCVVDKSGEIIASARMDGKAARFIRTAHRKAYTGAIFERDTKGVIKFWDQQAKQGHRGPSDWNDTMITTLPGGYVVCYGKEVVGGVGIAGGNQEFSDEDFAALAIESLGEGFRHRVDWD